MFYLIKVVYIAFKLKYFKRLINYLREIPILGHVYQI